MTLTCEGKGEGNVEVRWFFNYVPLYKKPKKVTYVATFDYWLSQGNSTLTLYNINMNLKHEVFYCFIANHIGIIMAGKHQIMTVRRPGMIELFYWGWTAMVPGRFHSRVLPLGP